MRCDDALRAISATADGEPLADDEATALADHVATCTDCAGFDRSVRQLRTALRFEPVGVVPDVVPVVRQALAGRQDREDRDGGPATPRLRWRASVRRRASAWDRRAVGVAAAVGFLVGAAVVGLRTTPGPVAAANISARVLAAQHEVDSLDARFVLTEHGRPAGPASQSYDGRLTYEAPERLGLTLRAHDGGAEEASSADVHLVVDGARSWLSSVRSCSSVPGKVTCPHETTRWVQAVTGREPFSEGTVVPLELVRAVDSFTLAAEPVGVGERRIAGREAVGVRVEAAQMGPFLEALSAGEGLRAVHPTDPVDVWLDAERMVPLAVQVRAAASDERTEWGAGRGYADRPGDTILDYRVTSLRVDGDVPADAFERPPGAGGPDAVQDDGFVPGDDAGVVPEPAALSDEMQPHVSGTTQTPGGPEVGVRTWTDGSAWLKVRATRAWDERRLFGGLGPAVRQVDLGDAGVGYLDAAGDRVALHGDDIDLVVTGSLSSDDLRAVAAGLGIVGQPVPEGWPEAATVSLGEAADRHPGLLTAAEVDGFAAPAVQSGDDGVTQLFAGPGDRSFVLVQRRGTQLSPPTDQDAVGTRLRGQPGRYSITRGEIEWIEAGSVLSLRSTTLSLAELAAIADRLEEAQR